MDAPREKDPASDCLVCGDSPLVRAGNSYWKCVRCAPPPPPEKKTKKAKKRDEDQSDISDFF